MPIKLLQPEVAAKIAAGEVVERPASVVKELVENSLDAGASQVTVEVGGGGVEFIRVTDNGQGIPVDEVELVFHRHATSKLQNAEDLEAIATLGFRGEALPSIAAVSCVSLVSCSAGEAAGHELQLNWGQLAQSGPKGCPIGTSMTVTDLFGNQPARRKFLKSVSAEAARISDLVSRMALAFPEVRFQLKVEGRTSLATTGSGRLLDALTSVYGPQVAGAMLEVGWEGEGRKVWGLVSPPSLTRAGRSYITLLVNRRWIQSRTLSFALEQAYHGIVLERRYPLAVVNLSVPYEEVDVNVHPSKREVRFRHEDLLFSAVQRAVRAALVASSPVPEVHLERGSSLSPGLSHSSYTGGSSWGQGRLGIKSAPSDHGPKAVEVMPLLRVLGQVRNTYMVAEGPDGLYLIDQHAAHERVLFEQLQERASDKAPLIQPLLEPVVTHLSPAQEERLQGCMEALQSYGFLIESFGERSYLLRAVPSVVKDASEKMLVEVLDLTDSQAPLMKQEEALAASVACHSAVRGGMSLSQQEMEELVRQLEGSQNPHTCPHGRPTMVHLSSNHLEREFGRR